MDYPGERNGLGSCCDWSGHLMAPFYGLGESTVDQSLCHSEYPVEVLREYQ